MEKLFSKTRRLTSYNLVAKGLIIGNADINYALNDDSAVLEIYPYEPQLHEAGLLLTDQGAWHDFQELDTLTSADIDGLIRGMLATTIKSFRVFSTDISIEKRKDVFGLSVSKDGKSLELMMVYDLKPFVTEKKQHDPAILVHDPEHYDLWRFDAAASDETIVSDVLAVLRS